MNACAYFKFRPPNLVARNSCRYGDQAPNHARFNWAAINDDLNMIAPLNIFEFYKLLKQIPLYMMVATPSTYPVRSYH